MRLLEIIEMKITRAISDKEKNELDRLLWDVLWEPLGLPRDIRRSFKLNNPQIDLIAIDNGIVVGGLVANWLSEDEIEIRHIAVKSDYQGRSIGRNLVMKLSKSVQRDTVVKIQTYARDTSIGFFSRLSFIPTGQYLEHEDFIKHGIRFQQMYLIVSQAAMSYYFSRTLNLSFDEAVARVTEELKKEGFGILTEIDVKETLKKKLDVDFREYRILGACNPPFAYEALQTENKIGLMLPCNAVVDEVSEGRIEVSVIDPVASMAAVDNPKLQVVAVQVRDKLKKVIDSL
jgi:uncharacterized protein (DUF302 family)